MTLIIISSFLFCCYALLIMAYKRGWQQKSPPLTPSDPALLPKISVLIPARNEEKNVAACLHSILQTNFPVHLLEIIVIDDFSSDATADIAEAILLQKNGKVLSLQQILSHTERLNSYKKKALELAIQEAKGEWIITTDADCLVPKLWLEKIAAIMQDKKVQFIVAPVSFIPSETGKNLLYYFQSLDFMTMQGITAASAQMKLGNMCNGANLAFRKKAFEAVGGYAGIDHIASGDDMLLMHKIEQKYPEGIRYLKSPQAIVLTTAQPTWTDFMNQRIRWSSKADKYDDKKLTWILMVIYFFNVIFIILSIAGFFNTFYWLWLLGMLFAKTTLELIFLIPVAKFYQKMNELIYFPLLQPLHIIYIIFAGFLGKFGTYQWKGRKVQ